MRPAASVQKVEVCVGKAGVLVGQLSYARN